MKIRVLGAVLIALVMGGCGASSGSVVQAPAVTVTATVTTGQSISAAPAVSASRAPVSVASSPTPTPKPTARATPTKVCKKVTKGSDGLWNTVLCSDGSPHPGVRADLEYTYPKLTALPKSTPWEDVVATICFDAFTRSVTLPEVAQAYQYVRAKNGWTTYRRSAEIPDAIQGEEDLCSMRAQLGKEPRTDCQMPRATNDRGFVTVLCDDGSPNAKVEKHLLYWSPMTMDLPAEPTIPQIINAVCTDSANSNTFEIAFNAFQWKSARHDWSNFYTEDNLTYSLRHGGCEG